MTGNIWMCSHLLDSEDLDFGKHEFITYKMGVQYYSMGERRFATLFRTVCSLRCRFLRICTYSRHD